MVVAAVLMITGCQTWGPTWSEVSGRRYNLVEMNVAPTMIERVDDQGAFATGPDLPVRIEPGSRRVVLQAYPLSAGWAGGMDVEVMTLDAEPCKRYFINARFANPLGRSWTPFVDYVETISGCIVPSSEKK
jgi:hypothetical protein